LSCPLSLCYIHGVCPILLTLAFPYTTLFRSVADGAQVLGLLEGDEHVLGHGGDLPVALARGHHEVVGVGRERPAGLRHGRARARSEEHTSELQSHLNLVCRLLLEKKTQNNRE